MILRKRRAKSSYAQKRSFISQLDYEKFVPKTRGVVGNESLEKRIRDYRMHIHNLDKKVNQEIEDYKKVRGGERDDKKDKGSNSDSEMDYARMDYSGLITSANPLGI